VTNEPQEDGPAEESAGPAEESAGPAPPAPGNTRDLARLLAAKHAELAAKGFTEGLITASVERCLAYAQKIGSRLSPEIREAGTLDLLVADLEGAELWCENYRESMTT
jgi:hypothetical protein